MTFSERLIESLESRGRLHGPPEWEARPREMFESTLERLLLGRELPLASTIPERCPAENATGWDWQDCTAHAALRCCLGLSIEASAEQARIRVVEDQDRRREPERAECALALAAVLEHGDELRRRRIERMRMPVGPIAFEALYLSTGLVEAGGTVDLDDAVLTFARLAFEALVLDETDGLHVLTLVLASICKREDQELHKLCNGIVHRLDGAGYEPFATDSGSMALGEEKLAAHELADGGALVRLRIPLKGKGRLSTIEYGLPEIQSSLPATWERLCRAGLGSRRKADAASRQVLERLSGTSASVPLDLVLATGEVEVSDEIVGRLQARFAVAVEHLQELARSADEGTPLAAAQGLTAGRVTLEHAGDPGIHGRFPWSHTYRPDEPAYRVACLPDGSAFAILSGGWDVRFLGAQTFGEIREPVICEEVLNAVVIHPHGTLMACATSGDVRLYDLHEAVWREARLDALEPQALCFIDEGRTLLVVCEDGQVLSWSFEHEHTATQIWKISAPETIHDGSLSFAAGGSAMAWMTPDAEIHVLSPITASAHLRTIHPDDATTMALSPDGRLLAVGGQKGSIEIWSVDRGHLLGRFGSHREAVSSLAFSPDSRALVSSALDGKVRLWDATVQRPALDFVERPYEFGPMVFNPRGTTVALATQDGPVLLVGVMLL
jgi:hypothetical protein